MMGSEGLIARSALLDTSTLLIEGAPQAISKMGEAVVLHARVGLHDHPQW